MKILITGRPGIGKTTVVKKVIQKIPDNVCGFYTEDYRDSKKVLEFLLQRVKQRYLQIKSLFLNTGLGLTVLILKYLKGLLFHSLKDV